MNYRSSVCKQCLICVWIIYPVFVESVWFVYELYTDPVSSRQCLICDYTIIDPVFVDTVWFVFEL